ERVHAPGRLAGTGEHQHAEALPQPAPELAQDDEPDALGVLRHPGGVTDLPLDPRVREPAGRELGTDDAVGRAPAAVLDVDEHREVSGAARGPDELEVGRPRLVAVEPDDAVIRAGQARGDTPRALPAAGVDGLPPGDRDPDHPASMRHVRPQRPRSRRPARDVTVAAPREEARARAHAIEPARARTLPRCPRPTGTTTSTSDPTRVGRVAGERRSTALSHLRICDLSGQLAGAGATRFLAAFGAQVIRIEDPVRRGTWDIVRGAPPFVDD